MSRKSGFRLGALIATLMLALSLSAVALAASGTAPKLGSPNHRTVAPGRIKLTVIVPLPAASHGVFIKIQATKKTVHGHLPISCTVSHRCEYVEPKHRGGNKYVFTAAGGTFPGYWATTPGKYYWQAEYFTKGDIAHYYSKIGTFTIS